MPGTMPHMSSPGSSRARVLRAAASAPVAQVADPLRPVGERAGEARDDRSPAADRRRAAAPAATGSPAAGRQELDRGAEARTERRPDAVRMMTAAAEASPPSCSVSADIRSWWSRSIERARAAATRSGSRSGRAAAPPRPRWAGRRTRRAAASTRLSTGSDAGGPWSRRPNPSQGLAASGSYDTDRPVWGATTVMPPPTYMPTWYGALLRAQKHEIPRRELGLEMCSDICHSSAAVGRPGRPSPRPHTRSRSAPSSRTRPPRGSPRPTRTATRSGPRRPPPPPPRRARRRYRPAETRSARASPSTSPPPATTTAPDRPAGPPRGRCR